SQRPFLTQQTLPAGDRRTDLAGPRGRQAPAQQAPVTGVEDHHERAVRRAGIERLPLLRSAAGVVDHPARPRDHAPNPRADRSRRL
ncbi:hypothetical protein BLA29_015368, partial [Euroglyphus maynei]